MKKRFIAATSLAVVAALSLAGCSDPGNGGGAAAPADWPAQDTKLDGTTLTIWAAQNSNKIPDSVVTGFEAATGATVDV
ncbi:sugar-binding protein, partial [Rhodococcus sp. 06-1477-1B]